MMQRRSISSVFESPGRALLRSPFGSKPCYFLGIFYPFRPTSDLVGLQERVVRNISSNSDAIYFKDSDVKNVQLIKGDILSFVYDKTKDDLALNEHNVAFLSNNSGICITQEERFLLASAPTLPKQGVSDVFRFSPRDLRAVFDSCSHLIDEVRILRYVNYDNLLCYGYDIR